jgi:Phosphotransferase enzyme family
MSVKNHSHYNCCNNVDDDVSLHVLQDSILPYLKQQLGHNVVKSAILEERCQSAQHAVYIFHFPAVTTKNENDNNVANEDIDISHEEQYGDDDFTYRTIPKQWQEVFENGCNRIVIRIWMGGSRWWNLNHPTQNDNRDDDHNEYDTTSHRSDDSKDRKPLVELAMYEIWGYQLARKIFLQSLSHPRPSTEASRENNIRVPKILCFSCPDHDNDTTHHATANLEELLRYGDKTFDLRIDVDDHQYPWSIMEYVGSKSKQFSNSGNNSSDFEYYDDWIKCMVKERDEYGFEREPHPRWGRIPVTDCISYAETILTSIILPIHHYFLQDDRPKLPFPPVTTYMDMVHLYRQKYEQYLRPVIQVKSVVRRSHPDERGKLFVAFDPGNNDRVNSNRSFDPPSNIRKLDRTICQLEQEANQQARMLSCPTPVLCHMDLQPQNLLFGKQNNTSMIDEQSLSTTETTVVSIFDWEEAAYADPRFEILLLCRKVCANRQQADYIWNKYYDTISETRQEPQPQEEQDNRIDPWLKLEVVHNLLTLFLQLVAKGGRNSWETNQDLLAKIERDFQRLVWMGWTFLSP